MKIFVVEHVYDDFGYRCDMVSIHRTVRGGAIGRCESRSRALHCDFYSPENHPDLDDLPYVTYYEMELED